MLTPSQIAEMAEKHRIATYGEDSILQLWDREVDSTYIAAFTDAMELMSKEWVSKDDVITLFDVVIEKNGYIIHHPEKIKDAIRKLTSPLINKKINNKQS